MLRLYRTIAVGNMEELSCHKSRRRSFMEITINELRQMKHKEGMILQGCGGYTGMGDWDQ